MPVLLLNFEIPSQLIKRQAIWSRQKDDCKNIVPKLHRMMACLRFSECEKGGNYTLEWDRRKQLIAFLLLSISRSSIQILALLNTTWEPDTFGFSPMLSYKQDPKRGIVSLWLKFCFLETKLLCSSNSKTNTSVPFWEALKQYNGASKKIFLCLETWSAVFLQPLAWQPYRFRDPAYELNYWQLRTHKLTYMFNSKSLLIKIQLLVNPRYSLYRGVHKKLTLHVSLHEFVRVTTFLHLISRDHCHSVRTLCL